MRSNRARKQAEQSNMICPHLKSALPQRTFAWNLVGAACLLCGSSGIAVAQQVDWAESFEAGAGPWQGLALRASEYDAPVDGVRYAILPAGGDAALATTPVLLQAGRWYEVTVWARSVYSTAHLAALQSNNPEDIPAGVDAEAIAEIGVFANGELLAERAAVVSPTPILGAPETETNDDGANVWVDADAGFRHSFAENHFYQPIGSDPITGEWFLTDMPLAFAQDDMMAKTAAIFPDGTRRLYGFNSNNPFCQGTGENCQAILFADVTGSGDPDYDIPPAPMNNYVVWHSGDEDPWLGDPHVFVDDTTGKSWLTFGGGTGIYVAELDSTTGYLAGFAGPVSFDANPEVFTKVADWSGDEWTADSEWFEGAALWRHGEFWYLFTSNGSLAENYTIRVGRGASPTGPFLDKLGRDMNAFDPADQEFGNSFLLGDDADQLLPGHAHLWQEGGRHFLGYDYRVTKVIDDVEEFDYMGIRELHWEQGWPTIWRPITVSFDADDTPQLIGQPITIALLSLGEPGSIVAYDHLTIRSVDATSEVRVGLLGDSITEGVFGTTYASFLADRLGPTYFVLEWEGRKGHGVSGATLVRDSFLPIWDTGAFADLLVSRPDIVTIMLGSNDASEAVPPALFANYERDLNDLIDTLEAIESNPEVVLCTSPPAFALDQALDDKIRTVLVPIIERVADQRGLRMIDVYRRVNDYPQNWPDLLHPDAAGNQNLAEIFLGGLTRPRCAAGWAEPLSQTDFFDVVEFLRRFDATDPATDLAPPFSLLDTQDIATFLERATQDCAE